jgi:hypothetical protein
MFAYIQEIDVNKLLFYPRTGQNVPFLSSTVILVVKITPEFITLCWRKAEFSVDLYQITITLNETCGEDTIHQRVNP